MSAFNAIGGIIFGTIILSVIWFIVIAAAREANNDKSDFDGTWVVIIVFVIMVCICVSKCS